MFEWDSWGLHGSTNYGQVHDALSEMEMNQVRAKTSFVRQLSPYGYRAAWSQPYAGDSVAPASSGFNCEDGSSLNVMGECLWSFKNVNISDDKFEANISIKSYVKEIPAQPDSAGWSFSITASGRRSGQRVYLTALNPGWVIRLLDNQGSPLVESTVAAGQSTWVSDLDDLPEGSMIQVRGAGRLSPRAQIVERTGVLPRTRLERQSIPLRSGEVWASAAAELPPYQTISVTLPTSPSWFPGGRGEINGALRLVIAAERNASRAISKGAEEGFRVTYCSFGTIPSIHCGSLAAKKFPAARNEPIVLLVPISKTFVGSNDPSMPAEQFAFEITREVVGSTDRLWLLAADFVRTDPQPDFLAPILNPPVVQQSCIVRRTPAI